MADIEASSALLPGTVRTVSGGLADKSVGVEGIAGSQTDVLLRDGRRIRHVLKAEAPSFTIDADSSRAGVFKDYAALGVEHILLGWDHLLFVLACCTASALPEPWGPSRGRVDAACGPGGFWLASLLSS